MREKKLIEAALALIESEDIENQASDLEENELSESQNIILENQDLIPPEEKNKKRANRFQSDARVTFRKWRKMSGF